MGSISAPLPLQDVVKERKSGWRSKVNKKKEEFNPLMNSKFDVEFGSGGMLSGECRILDIYL